MGNCSGRSASSERVKTDPTVNGCMSERYDIETARQLKKKIRTDYRLHKYYSVIAKSEQTKPHGKIVLGRNLITGSIRKIYKFENHDPESGLVLENLHNLDIFHPNIAYIYEMHKEQNKTYVIMDNCSGLNLQDYLIKQQFIQEAEAQTIFSQIMNVINYLHKQDIIHGKLNIRSFQFGNNSPTPILKLIDLIDSRLIENDVLIVAHQSKEFKIANYQPTKQNDIWSCGIILYQLLSGFLPYQLCKTIDQQLWAIQKATFSQQSTQFDKKSAISKKLLSNLLQTNIKTRFTSQQVLQDNWFKKIQVQKQIQLTSLKTIQQSKKLNQVQYQILLKMAELFGEQDLEQILMVYSSMDINKDGTVSKNEIKEALVNNNKEENITVEIEEIFAKADSDHNGTIDYIEFTVALIDRDSIVTHLHCEHTFNLIDINSKGKISSSDISKFIKLEQQQIKDILKTYFTEKKKHVTDSLNQKAFTEFMMDIL